jgi:hypothetical protein
VGGNSASISRLRFKWQALRPLDDRGAPGRGSSLDFHVDLSLLKNDRRPSVYCPARRGPFTICALAASVIEVEELANSTKRSKRCRALAVRSQVDPHRLAMKFIRWGIISRTRPTADLPTITLGRSGRAWIILLSCEFSFAAKT